MDFSSINSITIPEGEVSKISFGNIVLWEKKSGLPSDYQQVEYIENVVSTNTTGSYLDLGFSFDTACTFYVNFIPPVNSAGYFFGAAESSGRYRCMITDQTANTLMYGFTSSAYTSVGTAKYNGEKNLKVEMKKGLLKLTDLINNTSSQVTTQAEYTMTNNLFMLAQNYNGSARVATGGTKLKSFSYYDKNDALICNLVPCYRKSDGVVGMYDVARKLFLANVGINSFKKGADV